jgi:hypothetical protein
MILLRSVSGAQQHRPAPARCNHSQPPARGPAGAGRRAIAAFRLTAVSTGTLGAGNRFGFASAGEKSQTPLAVVSRAAEHGLHLALARETAAATPERGGLEAPDCSSSALCVHPVGQDRLRQRGKHHQRSVRRTLRIASAAACPRGPRRSNFVRCWDLIWAWPCRPCACRPFGGDDCGHESDGANGPHAVDQGATVGNPEAAALPKVVTRPGAELSEVQKPTREDYIGANETNLTPICIFS